MSHTRFGRRNLRKSLRPRGAKRLIGAPGSDKQAGAPFLATHNSWLKMIELTHEDQIAHIRIDNPPVNIITSDLVEELSRAVKSIQSDSNVRAVLIDCAGKTFVAGGDIQSFEDPAFSAVPFNRVLADLEALNIPVVAALHGTVLGGGLELALACHYRVCAAGTLFGMPEVTLGLLPGSLGTQRLPRLIGIEPAFRMISTGRSVNASEAEKSGLVDRCVETDPFVAAKELAQTLISQAIGPRRTSEMEVNTSGLPTDYFDQLLTQARAREVQNPAQLKIVEAVQASLLPFVQGEQIEAQGFEELRASPQSRALRYLFFAKRLAAKIPSLSAKTSKRTIEKVGVLGAGTMGTGIAMSFLNNGLPVHLVEASEEALRRGMDTIARTYDTAQSKGKLSASAAKKCLALLKGSTDDLDLGTCDLIIEAVYEDMALKKTVAARLAKVAKPSAIIATNTSTLNVDDIAAATGRAEDVVGMHFFSPAHIMRLLEVVRGGQTHPDVLATVMDLSKKIGKTPVVSGVCYGFIGNRMAEVYMREAEFLLLEGASPGQIDGAVQALGMAMGPCRMLDMAGVDVGAKTVIELEKSGKLVPDPTYRLMVRKLYELGRHGQKTGDGYYRYEGRSAIEDPQVVQIAAELAKAHGIVRRSQVSDEELVERLMYPLINEAALILEEGIAYRGSDIDVVWTEGYGFPAFRGGPLFMADEIGLAHIIERLEHYAHTRGNRYGYWSVSSLLRRLAESGEKLADYGYNDAKSERKAK